VAKKAKFVEGIDPSDAVFSAETLLEDYDNVRITQAEVSNLPFEDESFDFVYSLGVLHHIPDTQKAMENSVKKLKKGGYFLVYLYYNLDNRGAAFKLLFHLSNIMRHVIFRLPGFLKRLVCDFFAITVYLPFVYLAKIVKGLFPSKNWYEKIPLSMYHNKSFFVIRNDSLDRFGTPLEQRFSKVEIQKMMTSAGLSEIVFSKKQPFWHAIGRK
jgi:SAM-dependent methyltransferase